MEAPAQRRVSYELGWRLVYNKCISISFANFDGRNRVCCRLVFLILIRKRETQVKYFLDLMFINLMVYSSEASF